MANLYDRDINKHIDWNGDAITENRPVSGRAIQKFIKDTLQSKIGYVYEDLDNGLCLGFADEEDYNTYILDPDSHKDLLLQSWSNNNADLLYGPWSSIEEAYENIPKSLRKRGLTIGIATESSFEEYQWKLGIENEDLVQKVEQLTLSLHLVGASSFTKNEGDSIFAQFIVNGGAGVKKAMLYQVVNNNEIFVQEYNNVGKGSAYTFTIPNPEMAGIYHYRIKVLDNLDNYAITAEELNYVEYTLYYGGISTIYNLTEINAITVKNYTTIAEMPFQLNITVRDNTFNISRVSLTDSTDDNPENLSVELLPSSGSYLGNNTYYTPNASILEQFNGKQCSVVVTYVESGTVRELTRNVFKLFDIGTLDIVPEYEGIEYHATVPGYYTFQLQSGVENLSVVLTPGNNSDFNFERSTVLAYRRFSLRVIPNNTIKQNAQIVLNYYYTYNNIEYTGSFTRTIGNILELPEQSYYEPPINSTITRETLVYSDIEHNTDIEDSQYYTVISEPVTTDCLSSSFILDTYCKINQQNDKTIKYITITYGGVEVASITEDEISCATQWGNLYTDTPINEWVQIGIGVNLQESFTRNEQEITGNYHCIYINGMVVKTVLIDNSSIRPLIYNSNNRLVVTIKNGILVQKCFLYYRNDGENIISPNISQNQNISIIYNNYKSHKLNFEEPQDLPVLKFLRISDPSEMAHYFELINDYKDHNDEDLIKHLTTFGVIGSQKAVNIDEYDPNYNSLTIESNATLFRQSVDIKKPAQKEYAVLCKAMWMGQEYNDVVVEIHTQGTSTLVYSVPNFKFTFWRVTGNSVERYCPEFIKKDNSNDYYEESVYTAKADFMDSSHLNNTPTCNYYNALIQNLIDANKLEGSPSARNNMLDAIMGFPIVMEISDTAESFNDIFTNIGSFMLNIDKTGTSLGFEVNDAETHLSCISFEGTSNDNDTGAAGRFDIPNGVTLKEYVNLIGEIDEAEIRTDYNFAKNNIVKKKGFNDTIEFNGNQILVKNHPYIKWCDFLSDGLEYRYPDSDIIKEKDGKISKIMDIEHFIALYKMWWWVYKSNELSQSDYKAEFVKHFDLKYCMLYFINLMIYAQTDNLGKNAMFDSWGERRNIGTELEPIYTDEIWYPRPYDLDSEAGLDNNGNDNIATFVEIRPSFSLNYDLEKENDYDWLSENYLLDETVTDPETGITYPATTIEYGGHEYDRYHFSSNKSKLWITFYKNFKDEINSFYGDLRRNCGYDPETIISLCKTTLIDKLGTAQYNQDFKNKYLANNDQRLAYGNRWYKFKKWLTKRFAFCDSYFGATDSAMYNITSRINYNVRVDAPQYIAQQYQGAANRDTRFVLDEVSFSAGSGAATIITLLVNQPSVFETSLFKNVVLNQGTCNYRNLISLDVSGNKNSLFTSINSVTGDSLDNLKYLNISNSAVQILNVPKNVKTLIAENVNLNTLSIPDGCAVEEISLKGSTFSSSVDFSRLPNLTTLDLTDCTFNQGVTFANLPRLETLIMIRAIFKGNITISEGVNVTEFDFSGLNIYSISFSGSNLQINTINFHNTKFGVTSLNLNAISHYIQNLYFDNCQGLSHLEITNSGTFDSLRCLSLYGSSIKALGINASIFDCSHFTNMGSMKKVSTWNTNGTITETGFTFQNTIIERISNISWNGTGVNLFRDCQKLISIGGTLNLTTGIDYMCYRCYVLETLPTINIDSTVQTATYVFAGANALSYSDVSTTIRKCTQVTDFGHALRCKQFGNNQTVSLSTLFENNTVVTNINSLLSQSTGNSIFRTTTNNIIISGKIPSTVTTATWAFYNLRTVTIPYDLLSDAESLTDTTAMFANSTVTFSGNNRPTHTDNHDMVITLTNAIDHNFLCNNLTNVRQMFFNSNVITKDAALFASLSNLTNTNAMFGSTSVKSFNFKNSSNETEVISLDVVNMWANNPKIENIAGCFVNIYSVYCTGLNFHQDVNKTVNISSLFGLSDNTYRSFAPITIDLDGIVPKIITDYQYAIPNAGSYAGPGVFQNRSVNIISTPSEGKIFGKISSDSRSMFKGAIIYLPNTVTTFDLDEVTYCNDMFNGCRLYTLSSGSTYTVNDRKFVNVILPSRCSSYIRMFQDSSVLASLPNINSSGAADLSYMYAGCVINTPDLQLPSDYFEICAESLSNTSRMFYNNQYLTTLEYSASRGLFEGCTNLSNVNYMFYGASFLHKGIPVNFFGSTPLPKLTSLAYMFGLSTIIYDVEDNSNKYINTSTIMPLVNLDNIQQMFYRIKINSSVNQFSSSHGTMRQKITNAGSEVAVIDPSTFTTKPITNISKLFEHTVINPPVQFGGFRFTGFTIGTDAFFSSSVDNINENFVDNLYVSSIVNADRMFYQAPNFGRYHSTITNLSTFIDKIIRYPNISKFNIAGNISDQTIPEIYTDATTEGDAITFSGIVLTAPQDLEGTWTNYRRHFYI